MIDNIITCASMILVQSKRNQENLFKEQEIEAAVQKAMIAFSIKEEEMVLYKTRAVNALQTRFNVTVSTSAGIYGTETTNWLTPERIKTDLNKNGYWMRYKRYLESERSPEEWKSVDNATNDILGHLADPKSGIPQQKKGLVIGDVQSGKTSNYAGLICKATDCGYRIIIVIAGTMNGLRAQTQERIEHDYVGFSTLNDDNSERPYGVSIYNTEDDSELADIKPFTSCSHDFSRQIAEGHLPNFNIRNNVALLVIKKQSRILGHVINFFNKLQQVYKDSLPVLIIDDEADSASINTKPDDEEPTIINRRIRELLSQFKLNSYVGYTATPYANIFINPNISGEAEAEQDNMANQDLFPKDFIYCLGRPSKYIGAAKLFESDEDSADYNASANAVQIIKEEPEFMDFLQQIDASNQHELPMPDSLKNAIRTFIISKAIRTLRGDDNKHCTMLIHATMKQAGHAAIQTKVKEYLREITAAIKAYIKLRRPEKRDALLADLRDTWQQQFGYANIAETWEDVCQTLSSPDYMKNFQVIMDNANVDKRLRLVYSKDESITPIVIGGNTLARGLTLEGLCTSYFLRRSNQYDSLMQMGRWFGYRSNYEDICRIFTTQNISDNFAVISRATDELKDSIRIMNREGKTPLEFGLRVRNSVGGLLITARNKMRSAETRTEWLDYSGNFLESYIVPADRKLIDANNAALHKFIKNLDAKYKRREHNMETEVQCGIIWENISCQDIENYIRDTKEMIVSPYIDQDQLISFVQQQRQFDVCLVTIHGEKQVRLHDGTEIAVPVRLPRTGEGCYPFRKNHPFSKNHEMGYQTKETMSLLKEQYRQQLRENGRRTNDNISDSDIPGKYYRGIPGRKNLMLISFLYVPTLEDTKAINKERDTTEAQQNGIANPPIPPEKFSVMTSIYGFSFSHSASANGARTTWTVNRVQQILEQNAESTEDDQY